MPDHININHPDVAKRYQRTDIQIAELKAKIGVLEAALTEVRGDLAAIFTRVRSGRTCELHMEDGIVFVITGKKRNDAHD